MICSEHQLAVQGDIVYGAITDNWPTLEPYFNETGSNCPSNLPRYCLTATPIAQAAWFPALCSPLQLLGLCAGALAQPACSMSTDGASQSALQRRQQQIELCELAVEAVKALGFQAGALHVELKYTSRNGPQLIEVPPPTALEPHMQQWGCRLGMQQPAAAAQDAPAAT